MKILPLFFAVISAVMPVVFQKTGLSDKHGFPLKMLCAFMYLLTGVASAAAVYSVTEYTLMMLGALGLGVLGDFFLEYKGKRFFSLGAVFFALGHILYSAAFLFAGDYKAITYMGAVAVITALLTAAVVAFAKLKLELKGKKNLLLLYAPVLIFAFVCAVTKGAVCLNKGNACLGLCLICGGTLFLFSDIMIGIGKGGVQRSGILHYAVSYTYFAAQALFALSIYFQ